LAALALVLSTAGASSLAQADESTAEQLFQEGLSAMKRSDYAVACEAFSQSNKADPSPGTQINLALCFEKQRKWASAWTWYRSAVGLAQQRKQREREQLAEDSANRLRPQLHYLVVAVKDPPADMVVKRDGSTVTVALAGKDVPLPIDPGSHTIEVTAPGKRPWSKTILAADNAQTDRVEVSKLEDAPIDKPATPGPSGSESTPTVIADGSGQRTVGIVVGATGILSALAAGGVFILSQSEISSRNKQEDALPATPIPAKPSVENSIDSHNNAAKNDQLIALILGGGAIVLLGVGGYLYFTAPKGSEKSGKVSITPAPLLSPTFAGLGLGANF
jgi:hypothetical protein